MNHLRLGIALILFAAISAHGAKLKSFVLGESLHSRSVFRAPDVAASNAADSGLMIRPSVRLFRREPKSAPEFELWIENPTPDEVAFNLLHFSVMGGPLILVEIRDAQGVEVLIHPPEIYPSADPRVTFEELKLPAHARLAIRQSLMLTVPPLGRHAKAKWSIWLDGRMRQGISEIE